MKSLDRMMVDAAGICVHSCAVGAKHPEGMTLCVGCAVGVVREYLSQRPDVAEEVSAFQKEKGDPNGYARLIMLMGDPNAPEALRKEVARALRALGKISSTTSFVTGPLRKKDEEDPWTPGPGRASSSD